MPVFKIGFGYKAVYPFPAHEACYNRHLANDKKRGIFMNLTWVASLIIGSAYLFLIVPKNGSGFGLIPPVFAFIESVLLLWIGLDTFEMIKHYCEKNIQK